MNELVYHYTTISSVKKILSSGSLLLSHYKDVRGDQDELRYGLRIFKEEALKQFPNPNPRNPLYSYIHSTRYEEQPIYFACFCTTPYNEHLWKKYANGGGVIGFDSSKLKESYAVMDYHPMSYDENSYRNICVENIKKLNPIPEDELQKFYQDIELQKQSGISENAVKINMLPILQNLPNYQEIRQTLPKLAIYASLLKHHKYNPEKELRLSYTDISPIEEKWKPLDKFSANGKDRRIKYFDPSAVQYIGFKDSKETIKRKGTLSFLEKFNFQNIEFGINSQ